MRVRNCDGYVNLDDILYTQNSIKSTFRRGESIYGRKYVDTPLLVVKYTGKFYTIENRTLYSKHYAGEHSTKVKIMDYARPYIRK